MRTKRGGQAGNRKNTGEGGGRKRKEKGGEGGEKVETQLQDLNP